MKTFTNLNQNELPSNLNFMIDEKEPIDPSFQFFPKKITLGLSLWITSIMMLFSLGAIVLLISGKGSWKFLISMAVLFGIPGFIFLLESIKDFKNLNKLKKGKYRVGVFINSENLVVNLESSHFIIPFTEIKGYERYFHKERDAENNISTEYTIILVMNDEKRIRLPKEFLWYEIFEKFGWKELVEPIHSEKYKKYYLNIGIPEDQNLANEIRMGYWEKGKIERE